MTIHVGDRIPEVTLKRIREGIETLDTHSLFDARKVVLFDAANASISLPFVPIVLIATPNGWGFRLTLKPACSRLYFAIWAYATAAAVVVWRKLTSPP